MIRTTSAKFQIRNSPKKFRDFLWLMPPYPKEEDFEWGLRMAIDKWYLMIKYPKIDDFGSGSCGLCKAAGNLSNLDNQCGLCPVKVKTGASNCINTPLKMMEHVSTWDEFLEVYTQMLEFLRGLYLDVYGMDYHPEIFVDE